MPQPAQRSVQSLTLDELVARAVTVVDPVLRERLRREPGVALAARSMVSTAIAALKPLLRTPQSRDDDGQASLAKALERQLGGEASLPPERAVQRLVHDAADAMMTTWLDVLDQGCEEHDGELSLHPEILVPGTKQDPELFDVLVESLGATVLTEEDAHHIMAALRERFPNAGVVDLPLGLRLIFEQGGAARATRREQP